MRQPVIYGKYLLLDRISVGGMAEVFQAKAFGAEGFQKILAIKRILPSLAEDEEFIDMFIDEAKIAGQLSHANICQIYELGRLDTSHFIAMEYVWGKDTLQIQNRLRKLHRRMPLSMAGLIAAEACEGLDYAHRKLDADGNPLGIVHRDVSPQNIIVSYEGEVKIIDFGIAKAVSRSAKTQAGVLKGKFGYMSPEQVRGLPIDHRSDVFALGTILWEMCVGERLFTGESDFAVLEKVRNADVARPSQKNPLVPPDLEEIVLRALAKDVDDRYQDARQLQADLMAFLSSQSPAYTTKELSAELKAIFAEDREREHRAIEAFRQVDGREDLSQRQDSRQREAAVSLLGAQSLDLPAVSAADETIADDYDDGATELGGPEFGGELPLDLASALLGPAPAVDPSEQVSTEDAVPSQARADGSYDDGRTEIYAEEGPRWPAQQMASESTHVFDAEELSLAEASLERLVDESERSEEASGAGAEPTIAAGQTVEDGQTSAGDGAPAAAEGQPGTRATTSRAKRKSTPLLTDVLFGVVLAFVVILGIGLWRAVVLLSDDDDSPATLVVNTSPPLNARVLVNGSQVGAIAPGRPLSKRLDPGEYKIAVVVRGRKPLTQQVRLQAGQVKVALFSVTKAVGYLALRVVPADARIFVDDKEIAHTRSDQPLELTSGVPHRLRVSRSGYVDQRFDLSLSAGQWSTREVNLKRQPGGRLEVRSRPSGASVQIDGQARGQTPLSIEHLASGTYRLTVRKEGFLVSSLSVRIPDEGSKRVRVRLRKENSRAVTRARVARGASDVRSDDAKDRGTVAGYLVANTTPWAKVLVDGADTGRTTPIAPRSRIALRPGRHVVTFVVGEQRYNFTVRIQSGATTRLIKNLPVN